MIKISPINFKGRIIDSHAHVGTLKNNNNKGKVYTKQQLDVFVKTSLPNNDTVEKMLVSDIDIFHRTKPEYSGNKELIDLFKNDKKYGLIASCSPADGDVNNIKKLYQEHPNEFLGLKFHPNIQNLPITDKKYEPYLDFANKNKIPCLFHSAVAVDNKGKLSKVLDKFSDPEAIYSVAKKYKETPVIIAHLGAGWNEAHDRTIDVLVKSIKNNDANLYADISWVDIDSPIKDGHKTKEHVLKLVKKLKGIGDESWTHGDQTHRILFGSDAPIDRFSDNKAREHYSNFVDDIKFAIKNDKDLKNEADTIIDNIFYKNSEKLFLNKKTEIQNKSNNKALLIGAGIVAVISGLLLFKSNKKDSNDK